MTEEIKRKQFSNNFRPELYYQIMNLSITLKAKGLNKNANQLIEEGMRMVLSKYHEKLKNEQLIK